jgi:flagellin
MAINDISLTAGMRTNLFSLQQTAGLLSRTQERLSTGKKVNSALDNPVSFFAAQANMARANDIAGLKDAMGEAVQTIKAADKGISSITSLIDQAKALGQAAKGATRNQIKMQFSAVTAGDEVKVGGSTYTAVASSGALTNPATQFLYSDDAATAVANLAALINSQVETSAGADMKAIASGTTLILEAKAADIAITQGNYTHYIDVSLVGTAPVTLADSEGNYVFSERRALGQQYNEIMNQIDAIANSSGYKGTNLLMDEDLNVRFEGSALNVRGFSATASDLGLNTKVTSDTSGVGWGWSVNSEINADIGRLDVATSTLRSEASRLSNNLSIINVQNDFTTNLINTLTEGADKLTLADMNEEGANMLMLQTRQALGTTSLSLASQAAQSVLRLFG